ncbi:MAG: TIGR04086 family membrane protein [Wujia sp.]
MSKGQGALYLLKAMLIAYVITGILLFVLSWVTYKLELSDRSISAFVALIYIMSTAIASFYVGKCRKSRALVWGLVIGILYSAIVCLVSIIMSGGAVNVAADGLGTILLSIGGGVLGAFISCMGK